MATATYYYENGTGNLAESPVEVDAEGNLTSGGAVVVTGAQASEVPASGCYVLAPEPPVRKLTRKEEEEEAEAKRRADEAEAKRRADEAEHKKADPSPKK